VLGGEFHFAASGVTSSMEGIRKLREALVDEARRKLLRLKDDDEGVAALSEALPDVKLSDAESLLHGFAAAGHARLIEVLLAKSDCDVNASRLKDGCTALHIAQYRHHTHVVNVLLAHGADLNARNKWGETPFESSMAASASK
jgi:ankyrin repeat protein